MNKPKSPNPKIDKALDMLIKKVETVPEDVAVKIIQSAIAWEKVKHHIKDEAKSFDPENL